MASPEAAAAPASAPASAPRAPGAAGWSRRVNTRSALAIADCITVYLDDRSRMGMKNLSMYSMKATRVPKVISPWTMRPPAYQTIPATASEPIISTTA